jgi:hypothetical protein
MIETILRKAGEKISADRNRPTGNDSGIASITSLSAEHCSAKLSSFAAVERPEPGKGGQLVAPALDGAVIILR